jgi:hypothetical protein
MEVTAPIPTRFPHLLFPTAHAVQVEFRVGHPDGLNGLRKGAISNYVEQVFFEVFKARKEAAAITQQPPVLVYFCLRRNRASSAERVPPKVPTV